MKLGLRVFLGYFLIVGMTAWMMLSLVQREIKPVVRQVSEEALIETAYALAALIGTRFSATEFGAGDMAGALRAVAATAVDAVIWDRRKAALSLRVYVTDAQGIVVFDSTGAAVGKDYSQWNDVYLTLRGRYGARSTRDDPEDESSSVMYVAAPIRQAGTLRGVVTVGLPGRGIQPYIDATRAKLARYGALLLAASLTIGIGVSLWLVVSLRRVERYALSVSDDRAAIAPRFGGGTELRKLTDALETMRERLQGKAYVEQYVHSLTHELKSPLSAIRAAAELLADAGMPAAQRAHFLSSIDMQCERLTQLIERLLELARLEQRRGLKDAEPVPLRALAEEVAEDYAPALAARGLRATIEGDAGITVHGERFLLAQALTNLIDNAAGFADANTSIAVSIDREIGAPCLHVSDSGPLLPIFALQRAGERFFSLPRPDGRRGSGLGLNFVREVMALHGGSFALANTADGVHAVLRFPEDRTALT